MRACCLRYRSPTPSRLPAHTSPRIVCPPFDTAGRVGVQPAAESRHIQRHKHAHHVLGAHLLPARALSSRAFPLHTASTAAAPRPPPSPCPRLAPRFVCPPVEWQYSSAFNQPLSLDTSSVTTMRSMFTVHTRVPCAQSPDRLPCRPRLPPSPHAPPVPLPAPRPVPSALLSNWQDSSAFNQQLSLDTSSVATMRAMFAVR